MNSIPFAMRPSRRMAVSASEAPRAVSSNWSQTPMSVAFDMLTMWLTNTAGKLLVLKLIATLLNLPAATALPSGAGEAPLSGDIALLYARLSSNQTEFKHAVQLVELVVARAEDTQIWTAIVDLIARTHQNHRPTTPPQSSASFAASFQQTP